MPRGSRRWKLSRSTLVVLAAGVGVVAVLAVARGTGVDVVLSNKVGAGPVCLSSSGAGNSNTCDPLFQTIIRAPGNTATADVTLANTGTTDAQTFNLYAASCSSSDAPSETYHGSGNICGSLQMTVQEYSDPALTAPLACRYGGSTGATCDFSDAAATVSAFAAAHHDPVSGLDLGALPTGAPRYFRVQVRLLPSAGNPVQGRGAVFDLAWYAAGTSSGGCTITGTAGDDKLVGTSGHDVICGLGGNDTISGMGGNDTIDGGPGRDTISYRSARAGVRVDLTAGTTAGWTTDSLTGIEVVLGSELDDTLLGSPGNDYLRGFGGRDEIRGLAGNDVLRGGRAGDTVEGGTGSDVLKGGPGNDSLWANDQVKGNDTVDGGYGRDRCAADRGDRVMGCP